MDNEQAEEQRVEEERVKKGKQQAHEVSSHDASPSEPVAPEGRGRHSGRAQTRGRSQSHCPRKQVKSAPLSTVMMKIPRGYIGILQNTF